MTAQQSGGTIALRFLCCCISPAGSSWLHLASAQDISHTHFVCAGHVHEYSRTCPVFQENCVGTDANGTNLAAHPCALPGLAVSTTHAWLLPLPATY